LCVLFTLALSLARAQSLAPVDDATGTASIAGVVSHVDQQGQATPLAGIPVQLAGGTNNTTAAPILTGPDGRFEFTRVRAGAYALRIRLEGFKPFSRTLVMHSGEVKTQDIELELETASVSVNVEGQAAEVTARSSDPDTTLSDDELPALPMREQKYKEALPLVPGVLRTTDGVLNIKGEAEGHGMLLVDSAQMVDPVTGSFSVGIPLDAVQSLNVYETPYNAQFGGFSGGLATIESKAPPNQWQYAIGDFMPGLRAKSGHIAGVSAETPRAYLGGPLVRNKLNVSEAIDYTIKNIPVRGLAWPNNETRIKGFTSFTELQAILSPRHLLTASVVAFSARTQFANINSFVQQSASSNSGSKGAYASVNDTYQFDAGTLTSLFRYTRFDSNAYGQGSQDMLVTPERWGGNFFDTWTRTANQYEAMPAFQWGRKRWLGSHDLKIGEDIIRSDYHGADLPRPIHFVREDGSPLERIDFHGGNSQHASMSEVSEFAQDHWTVNDRLAFDIGFRLSTQSNGRSAALAPRVGLTYALDRSQKTVLHAGGGIFYDRVSLLAASFTQNPTRVITFFDEAGLPVGSPSIFQNVYLDTRSGYGAVSSRSDPGTSPRNTSWNIGVDRELTTNITLRFNYLQSQTSDAFVVNPEPASGRNAALLGLASNGNSHYREFQTSVHYRPNQRAEFTSTYIYSRARGDLNILSSMFVPFAAPVIRPNVNAYLPYDVPNRMLTSGVFRIFWGLTISPVVDIRNGFRYSAVDLLQNYVGTPDSRRYPMFFSLDAKIYKDFPVSGFIGPLKGRRLRVGAYTLNLTNHLNPHDVFNNVASPDFGHFVGFQHKVQGLLIDLIK